MRKLNKKLVAAAAGAAVIVAGVGVGYAFWSTTGTGGGSSTSTATPAQVSYVADFDASSLAPGSDAVVVTYSASNSSPTDLSVVAPEATITTDKTYLDAADHSQDCADFLHLSAQPTGGTVPHNDSLAMGTADLTMDNSDLNQDSCQGQEITITMSNS
jgi:hypothetical protein